MRRFVRAQIFPSCEDVVSLTLDLWCVDETADNTRLLCATDIGTKAVVLTDLQPPPVCRYLKITVLARYGMSTTRCKIPIGQFFGHTLVLDHDGYADPSECQLTGHDVYLCRDRTSQQQLNVLLL